LNIKELNGEYSYAHGKEISKTKA